MVYSSLLGNIQGTFSEHSGNIQGILALVDKAHDVVLFFTCSERKRAYIRLHARENRLKDLTTVAEGMALEQALRV
jgi:hypothetical protein